MKARYIAHNGMEDTEIPAMGGVSLIAPDGTIVEMLYRRSDGEISITVNGKMLIEPRAANVIRITRSKE